MRRTWRALSAALGLVASLVITSGCTDGNESDVRARSTTVAADNAPPSGICQVSANQDCFRIDTGQWVSAHRGSDAQGFILLDVGGPGYAPVDTDVVENSLPAALGASTSSRTSRNHHWTARSRRSPADWTRNWPGSSRSPSARPERAKSGRCCNQCRLSGSHVPGRRCARADRHEGSSVAGLPGSGRPVR